MGIRYKVNCLNLILLEIWK